MTTTSVPSRALRELLAATLPMFAGLAFVASVGVVDAYWIARTGVEPLAAFSLALPLILVLQNLLSGFSAGVTSLGARAWGRGDLPVLRAIARSSFALLSFGALLLAIGSVYLRGDYLRWIGAEPTIVNLAADYLLPILACIPLYGVSLWGISITRAMGDAKFTAWAMLSAASLNFVLCPIAVLGFGPIPAWGLSGAAYSTAAAFLASAILAALRLRAFLHRDAGALSLWAEWRAVMGEAGPAMVTNALWPVGAAVLLLQVGRFGQGATAAMGIIGRVENLTLMMPTAIAAALMPLVGRAWAHRDRVYVASLLRSAQALALIWGGVAYGGLSVFAPSIAAAFGVEGDAADATTLGLRLVPLSYISGGVMIVTSASLLSIGRPLRTTQISAAVNLAILPLLTAIGGAQYGLVGAYGAFVVTITLGMFLALHWSDVDGLRVRQPGVSTIH